MKIAVAGTDYVVLSLATLLSQNNELMALDIVEEKSIWLIIVFLLYEMNILKKIDLKSTLDYKEAFENANEDVIKKSNKITFVVKSTVLIGFVEYIRKTYNISNIFFSPKFLRKTLYDIYIHL